MSSGVTAPAPATTSGRMRPSVLRWLIAPWLLLSVLGSLWGLATPIGGSPDEPAHVIKAASVVRGQLLPEEMVQRGGILDVPAVFADEQNRACYPLRATQPASCAPDFTGDPDAVVETFSSASLYNPVYYAVVGWPSLVLPDTAGIYAMRILSAIVCSLFLAAAFFCVGGWPSRRLPALGVLAGITPMAVYLLGTVNPNSLEFAGGLALFAGMLSIVLHPDDRLLHRRLALVVVSALFVANTRGISALWVAVLLALPLVLLTGRELIALLKRRSVLVSIAVIVAGALFSAGWTLATNSLGGGPSTVPSLAPDVPGLGLSPLQGFTGMLGMSYLQLRQMIGILGWLDTPLSPAVYYLHYAIIAVLVAAAAFWARGRRLVLVILLGASVVLVPALLQAAFVTAGGFIWQGRYTLVLLLPFLLALAAVAAASPRFLRWEAAPRGRRVLAAAAVGIALAWTVAGTWAFATTMRRFTVGYLGEWSAMGEPGAWTPPLGAWPLIVVFVLVSAALGAWLVLVTRRPAPGTTAGASPGAAVSAR